MRRTTVLPTPTQSLKPSSRRAPLLAAALALVVATVPLLAPAATAHRGGHHGGHHGGHRADVSVLLPGATGAEGIAAGRGTSFYAGDLGNGDIFRGDVRRKTAELFIDAPDGRTAVGMKYDRRTGLLFVAGGPTGQAYVYDTRSGEPVATYDLGAGFINDVTLTRKGAWFTNSQAGELYLVPFRYRGELGEARALELSGPAAGTPGFFNLNGIASVRGGRTLLVAHSADATIYTVDPRTGESAETGLDLPNVDGILAEGKRVWAVQNRLNQVSVITLGRRLASGEVTRVITSPLFEVPTTVARFGSRLALPNAKFGVPGASEFDVVVVDARPHGARR